MKSFQKCNKEIETRIMITYPYDYSKNKYINNTCQILHNEYPNITIDIVETLVNSVVTTINHCISGKSDKYILTMIEKSREAIRMQSNISDVNQIRSRLGGAATLHSYKIGDKSALERLIHDEYNKSDDGKKNLLEDLLKNIALRCTNEICDATEKRIKEKEARQNWTEKVNQRQPLAESRSSTSNELEGVVSKETFARPKSPLR